MRTLVVLLGAGLSAAIALPAGAQFGPGTGAGPAARGPADEQPGAYASPSAIPEGTMDERFGLPRTEGRIRFDPIELPEQMRRGFEPDLPMPELRSFAPQMLPSPTLPRPEHSLILNARLDAEGQPIPDGLVWRLFAEKLNRDGQLQLLSVVRGGEAVFDVPAGSYLLHVGFGRAETTKRVEFNGLRTQEMVTLDAGGLHLNAIATPGAPPIRSDRLTFDVFVQDASGRDGEPIAKEVPSDLVLRLNAGAYRVVSRYGLTSASADVRVEAGRVTNVQLQQHAGELTMKLVREQGGEAIADTAWSIVPQQGEIIRGGVGAFSSMVLPEGSYVVIAKNRERTYQREVSVQAGASEEIEVLITESAEVGPETVIEAGSGD